MLLSFQVNSLSLIFDIDVSFLQARLGEIEKVDDIFEVPN